MYRRARLGGVARGSFWRRLSADALVVIIGSLLLTPSLLVASQDTASAANLTAVSGSLGSYNIDTNQVFVSGVSSGGFEAVQLDVAYSSEFHGAAIFAGGPYYCAQDSIATAEDDCMTAVEPISDSTLESDTNSWASEGLIDSTSNLDNEPIYLFSGTNDDTVKQSVMNDLDSYYEHYGANVTYNNTTDAGHGWISPEGPNSCSVTQSPYINNCGIDPEKTFLTSFLGTLNPENTGSPEGKLIEFSQDPYAPGQSANSVGMSNDGYVYVPSSCADGASCSLMVALTGCEMTTSDIGTDFASDSGLNEWADTNDMVVLYPEVESAYNSSNPDACWDWWGYLSSDGNYAQKSGAQMSTLMAMVHTVEGGSSSGSSAPSATTDAATAVTSSTATLNGTVDPNGTATSYSFEYGTSTSYGSTTPSVNAGSGTASTSASADLTGLAPDTTYDYQLVATNAAGTTYGGNVTFTTPAATSGSSAPSATTDAATAVTSSTATLNGTVDPNGTATSYSFEYGTSTSYGSTTPSVNAGSGTASTSASADLTGLAPDTTYDYQLVATNAAGTTYGGNVTFTTPAATSEACYTASNYQLTVDGYAYESGGYTYADGSNDPLGLWNTYYTSSVEETSPGYFIEVSSCP